MRLCDLRGAPVVLYVYPKANTPGCTTQACGVRDHRDDYAATGACVVGVSPDPVDAIKRFHHGQGLNFTLLADADHAVAERYGTWAEKSIVRTHSATAGARVGRAARRAAARGINEASF